MEFYLSWLLAMENLICPDSEIIMQDFIHFFSEKCNKKKFCHFKTHLVVVQKLFKLISICIHVYMWFWKHTNIQLKNLETVKPGLKLSNYQLILIKILKVLFSLKIVILSKLKIANNWSYFDQRYHFDVSLKACKDSKDEIKPISHTSYGCNQPWNFV